MIVILSSSSWSDLLQNEVSQIFKRIDMTKDDITLQLGERWAEALKKYFGNRNTAKEIARTFDVDVRTARGWLDGSAPYIKYIYIASQKLGAKFVAEFLTPNSLWSTYSNIDEALGKLEKEICQLRRQIETLKQENDK